jgi:phage replication initiation protein
MERTRVDWLRVTFREDSRAASWFLKEVFGPVGDIEIEQQKRGSNGFTNAATVSVAGANVASYSWGGTSQRGRAMIDIPGGACGLVRDWEPVEDDVYRLPDARLTRVDIAADFYHGEVTFDAVRSAYDAGLFAPAGRAGRPPKMKEVLPGSRSEGRTIYVGSRKSDVFFRGYEKGLKEFQSVLARGRVSPENEHLFDPAQLRMRDRGAADMHTFADWFRCELEFKSHWRELPEDVLTKRDQYFAGAYPFCQQVLPHADPQLMVSRKRSACLDLEKLLGVIREQYGNTLFTSLVVAEGDILAVWNRIVGQEHNQRLVDAGILLPDGV